MKLAAEAVRLFIREAIDRASEEATYSGDDMVRVAAPVCPSAPVAADLSALGPAPLQVEPSHVEQILAQLLIDF